MSRWIDLNRGSKRRLRRIRWRRREILGAALLLLASALLSIAATIWLESRHFD